jgi:hypothetical protein
VLQHHHFKVDIASWKILQVHIFLGIIITITLLSVLRICHEYSIQTLKRLITYDFGRLALLQPDFRQMFTTKKKVMIHAKNEVINITNIV